MNIKDIRINPENHEAYDINPHGCGTRTLYDKSMELSSDINRYLDAKLGEQHDWAGRYAQFLKKLYIQHETDNGWWSIQAVDPENLEDFVECMTDADQNARYKHAVHVLESLKDLLRFDFDKVSQALEVAEKIKV